MNDVEYFNKARINYFLFYDYKYDENHPAGLNIDPIPDRCEIIESGDYISKDDKIKKYDLYNREWIDMDISDIYPCIPFDIDAFYCIYEPDEREYPLTFKDLENRLKENKTMWVLIYPNDPNKMEYFLLESIDERTGDALYDMYTDWDAHWLDGDPLYKKSQ